MIDPAVILILLITVGGIATIYMSGTMGVNECRAAVKEQKQLEAEKRIQALQQKRMFQNAAPSDKAEQKQVKEKSKAKGTEGYENIFAPSNLEGDGSNKEAEKEDQAKGTEGYQNLFSPENLQN